MVLRQITIVSVCLIPALLGGCKSPPPVPPPEPSATAAPPPPPPPPKKCEAMVENCTAAKETRAKIANSDLAFGPPAGWAYAQQPTSTVAQTSDSGTAMAFTGVDVDPKDSSKTVAAKEAALVELAKQLGLKPIKVRINWKAAPDELKPGSLMQLGLRFNALTTAGLRGTKKGKLLIIEGPVTDPKKPAASPAPTKGLLGLGFVPADDQSEAAQGMLESLDTLEQAK